MTTRALIDDFLARQRLAVVGVSRDPKDFTRRLFDELSQRGYDLVPVNPNAPDIGGRPCYSRLQDIPEPVEGALIMTAPGVTEKVVRDCAAAGVRRVWMHRGEGIGAVSEEAIQFCQAHDIDVVPGFCPFMFLPDTGFFHRFHGFIMKIGGSYPN